MAEAALGPLIQSIESLIQRECGLWWGVKSDIEKLSSTLSTIQAVLADAEPQQIKVKAMQDWLVKLKDAAYSAEDILEEWATDEPLQQLESDVPRKNCTNRVRDSFMSLFNLKRVIFHYKIAIKIKKISERLVQITKEKSDFHLKERLVEVTPSNNQNRETSSIPKESRIYGRDADKERIVKMLLEEVNNEEGISVCPIIGIGGLGKTTLAQIVYNDDRVKDHFDERFWICVSNDFSVKRFLKEILEVLLEKHLNSNNLGSLQVRLTRELRRKKFLLVLDDVWSVDQGEWNMLKNSLKSAVTGSSIIITTRFKTVASAAGTVSPHHLGGLSEDDCWSLLSFYAFGTEDKRKQKMVSIGKDIVKKCSGSPLAAKTLGSLLRLRSDENQWKIIKDSKIWELAGEENMIMSTLRLSFNSLSPRARQCFAYCSLFPKDYLMQKEELVHLWLANGLLQFDIENMEPEDMGEIVFSELLLHSFFQDIKEDNEGNITTFKVHDLLHELASSMMKSEKPCVIEVGMESNVNNHLYKIKPHHLSITLSPPSLQASFDLIHRFILSSHRHLRTLLLFSHHSGALLHLSSRDISTLSGLKYLRVLNGSGIFTLEALPPSFRKLKLLRYLNLSRCYLSSLSAESFCGMKNLQILDLSYNGDIKTIPDSIDKLENLRLLNLSYNVGIVSLPESLCNLKKLQTLKLDFCKGLQSLPTNTSKLCSLKRLENQWCESLMGMPTDIGKQLTRLEKLSLCVGSGMKELKGLKFLGGSLVIEGIGHVRNVHKVEEKKKEVAMVAEEEEEELLTNKQNLSNVVLSWFTNVNVGSEIKNAKKVLQILKPPVNIEVFSINGYPGSRFPEWMQMRDPLSSFPRLMNIRLQGMHFLEKWLLNWKDGECLPALESLSISHCSQLKTLPEELGNCTALKSLSIQWCNSLVSVPQELQKLTSLESLSIHSCSGLDSLPKLQLMSSLKELIIEQCPQLSFKFNELLYLTSLEELRIQRCPRLVISKGALDSINALRVHIDDQNINYDIEVTDGACSLQNINDDIENLHL